MLGVVGSSAPVVLAETHEVGVEQQGSVTEVGSMCSLDVLLNDELKFVLHSFIHVFSAVPGKTSVISHKNELVPGSRPLR